MATIIKLKRSTSAGSIPTTSDIADGEVAINIADQKIYARNSSSIVEIANATSSVSDISTNVLPDTTATYNIGSLALAFKDLFLSADIKQAVSIFTNAGGLSSPAATFTFRPRVDKRHFGNVFTNAGGLDTAAITLQTEFNDSNPAYRF